MNCAECNSDLPRRDSGYQPKYCSAACRGRARRLTSRACRICNTETEGRNYYCSQECKNLGGRKYLNRPHHAHILRHEAIYHYGNACAECGEDRWECLQLDHINNDGYAHRREVGTNGQIYAWLKREGFPPGFQVLCANCHAFKTFYAR